MMIIKFVNQKNKKGISLVETILAVAMLALVVPAIIVLGVISLRSNNNAVRRSEASKLASSGIEAIKYVRDSCGYASLPHLVSGEKAYLKIDTKFGTICNALSVVNDGTPVVVLPDPTDPENSYSRTILIEHYGYDSIEVLVTVSWGDSGAGSVVQESAIVNSLIGF